MTTEKCSSVVEYLLICTGSWVQFLVQRFKFILTKTSNSLNKAIEHNLRLNYSTYRGVSCANGWNLGSRTSRLRLLHLIELRFGCMFILITDLLISLQKQNLMSQFSVSFYDKIACKSTLERKGLFQLRDPDYKPFH